MQNSPRIPRIPRFPLTFAFQNCPRITLIPRILPAFPLHKEMIEIYNPLQNLFCAGNVENVEKVRVMRGMRGQL